MQWTFFVRFHFTEHEVLLVEGEKWRKQNKRLYIFMSEDKSKAFPVQAPTWLFLFIFSIFFSLFFFQKGLLSDFLLVNMLWGTETFYWSPFAIFYLHFSL